VKVINTSSISVCTLLGRNLKCYFLLPASATVTTGNRCQGNGYFTSGNELLWTTLPDWQTRQGAANCELFTDGGDDYFFVTVTYWQLS